MIGNGMTEPEINVMVDCRGGGVGVWEEVGEELEEAKWQWKSLRYDGGLWTQEDLLNGIDCDKGEVNDDGDEVVELGIGARNDVGLYELVEVSKEGFGRTKLGKGSIIEAASVTEWNGKTSLWKMTSLETMICFVCMSYNLYAFVPLG